MQNDATQGRTAQAGGYGDQTISGGSGDDLIYGDAAAGATTSRLALLSAGREAGVDAAQGAGRAVSYLIDGRLVFFGAGADPGGGGLSGWTVDDDDNLVSTYSRNAWRAEGDLLTGARGIEAFDWQGESYLLTGGLGVSLSRLTGPGAPALVDTVRADWGDQLARPRAFATYQLDGKLHVLTGGEGLSMMRWDAAGLVEIASWRDDARARLSGVSDIAVLSLDNALYALTLSHGDAGLSVFRIDAGGLTLTDQRSPADDETGFDLSRGDALAVIGRAGHASVYAAAEWGALVVYDLDAAGGLTRLQTLDAASDVGHARIGGKDYVFAVDGGDEIRVYLAAASGRLTQIERIALGEGATAQALGVTQQGDRALLMIGRPDAEGFDLLHFRPAGDDVIDGGAGDDEIRGGAGADRLIGGEGDDLLLGETDADWLHGGAGADRLLGGLGADTLLGGPGADALLGGGAADRLLGGAGDDTLRGQLGDDVLDGGRGADALFGGAGGDRLEGKGGDDRLVGGLGADSLLGGVGGDRLIGGGGDDDLNGGGGADVLKGGVGDDALGGRAGRDVLRGGVGDDLLRGQGGYDRLFGAAGADRLEGGGGEDRLDGGGGADRLIGGRGNDVLIGGGGGDIFEFAARDGRDHIRDFRSGVDRIALNFDVDGIEDLRIYQQGDDAVVRSGRLILTLDHVDADDLGAGDFLFG